MGLCAVDNHRNMPRNAKVSARAMSIVVLPNVVLPNVVLPKDDPVRFDAAMVACA